MRPFYTLLRVSKNGSRVRAPSSCGKLARHSSIAALQSSLQQELTSRPKNYIFDYLTPTPSHLLNITLSDFLPESCYPPNYPKQNLELPSGSSKALSMLLPQAHHLVYFSPQVPSSSLLPDGTDHLQSPGPPFNHRMWAGGSLHFDSYPSNQLTLSNVRARCAESMSNVVVRGTEGDEKIFVTIKREIQLFERTDNDSIMPPAVIEERNLVYFRQRSPTAVKADPEKPGKILKPTQTPDFFVKVTPTPALLFRFSALTFNAHSIHLDPQYCREVESHRNLLVHGPLSLVLMLSVLRSQLKADEMVLKFEYRNLAPLYVGEEMRICVRKDNSNEAKYDVWIEGKGGGYTVKGTAFIGKVGSEPESAGKHLTF